MNCDRVKKLIPIYLDSEHEAEKMSAKRKNTKNNIASEEDEFKEHLMKCSSCKAEYDDMARLIEILHNLPEEDLPDDFAAKLHEELVSIEEKNENKAYAGNKRKINWKNIYSNRYIKAFSTAAACILIIFAVKILFENMSTSNTTSNLVMDNNEAFGAIVGEKAQTARTSEESEGMVFPYEGDKRAADSSVQTETPEATTSSTEPAMQVKVFSIQDEASETVCNGETTEKFVESTDREEEAISERGSDDETAGLTEARILMAESCELCSSSNIYSGEDIKYNVIFSGKSKIKVTILILNRAIEEETVRVIASEAGAIFTDEGTYAELGEKTVVESSAESIVVEFIIPGNKYEYFIDSLIKNTENLNLIFEYSTPELREDLETKLNDLSIKLESINTQINELENKNKTSDDNALQITESVNNEELADLKLQKQELEKQIEELIDDSEYTAGVVINIHK